MSRSSRSSSGLLRRASALPDRYWHSWDGSQPPACPSATVPLTTSGRSSRTRISNRFSESAPRVLLDSSSRAASSACSPRSRHRWRPLGDGGIRPGRFVHSGRNCPVLHGDDLSQVAGPFPPAENAYRALLEYQSGPYRIHETWADPELNPQNRVVADRAGEVVRSCMIESRKTSITSYSVFASSLLASHARLAQ